MLDRRSAWLVLNTQVNACSRESHSRSAGHLKYTDTRTRRSTMAAQHYSTPHTLWGRRGCAVELASSAPTAATVLADAAITPPVSEISYNVSRGTLNHTTHLES